ncbi:MAG TPA: hypothetical protein VFR37_17230, partial [Longimicrobium sp.]|nr:hypothetical protein [Longimicrobium sp.]
MNRRLSALLVPLALAGCATLPRGSADEGLRARISYDRQGVNVTVSEPAHLAIVEVVPGRRVSLLYPAPPEDVPYPVAVSRNRLHFPGWTLFSFSVVSGRRSRAPLMYMIASRHPLNEDLLRDMQAGSGTLHTELLRSSDPARTMELLASAVVPGQPEADW